MVKFERNTTTDSLLAEAIAAAADIADVAIEALRGRINDLCELEEARKDGLTGLWVRSYWERLVQPRVNEIQAYDSLNQAGNTPNAALLVFADAEDLHFINNRLGYTVGDRAVFSGGEGMKAFAEFMKSATRTHERRTDPERVARDTREYDLLSRLGGDEFAGFFLIRETSDNSREEIAQMLTSRFKRGTNQDPKEMPFISWGYTFILPGETKTLSDYLNEADPKAWMTRSEKTWRSVRKLGRKATGRYSW